MKIRFLHVGIGGVEIVTLALGPSPTAFLIATETSYSLAGAKFWNI